MHFKFSSFSIINIVKYQHCQIFNLFPYFATSLLQSSTYTEADLVEKLKGRDEQAFNHLYDNYSKSLFTIIYQIIPQQEVAEDVLQQVFVKIWKNIGMYDAAKGRLFTWMLNIARNQTIDYTRSKEYNNLSKTVSIDNSVYTADKAATNEVRDVGLKKLLEKLPAEHRKLLELSYFLGYTQEEISQILEIPLGTVKTRLRTIIIQLRKILG